MGRGSYRRKQRDRSRADASSDLDMIQANPTIEIDAARSPLRRSRGRLLLALLVLAAALAGVARWRHWWPFTPPPQAATAPPPVPVSVAKVTPQAVPITLTGLGTVQAYNTVTIRSRVDGQLIRVAYTEGQDVHEGDLLAEIDPHPYEAQLAQARAKFAQDSATLKDAQAIQARYAALVSKQDVSRATAETQAASVEAQTAQVQADQAAIGYAGVQLNYTKITAPIGGRTGVRLVDQGNIVHATDPGGLVVITQLQPISLLFTLPQDALQKLQSAMRASTEPLQVEAFGRDPAHPLATGTLALVNNQVNPQTGTVELKATFPNDDHALWPGQFVTGRVRLMVQQDAPTAPASAVQRGQDGTLVFVVGADNKAELRHVDVQLIRDGTAVFSNGLKPGETVITQGQFKVKAGTTVHDTAQDKK